MFEIPNIPLKLPVRSNIHREPSYPYPFATEGALLGKHFQKLVNLLIENWIDEERLQNLLIVEFVDHRLADLFIKWDLKEVGDFCRHVLSANKDELGWDICDLIDNRLNNIVVPSWRLPNFEFIEHFNNILSRIHKIYFPHRLLSEIKRILESNIIEEIQIDGLVKKHLNLWTIKELWLLLGYLGSLEDIETREESQSLRQLLNLICNTFNDLIVEGKYPVHERLCLILLFIDGYAGLNKQTALRSKEFVDRIWDEIDSLPYTEKISYKYLLGAAYSLIGEQLFRQDTDFITRKLFVNSFIENYVDVGEYNLRDWFNELIGHEEINELVLDLLVRGYSKTVPLLRTHIFELPLSQTKTELIATVTHLNHLLQQVVINYLKPPTEITSSAVSNVLNLIDEKFMFYKVRRNMLELLYSVSSHSIFLDHLDKNINESNLHLLTFHVLEQAISKERAIVFKLDYDLNTRTYPFDEIYSKITEEVDITHSLILSTTFENEIISIISRCIQAFIDISTESDLFLDVFEVLLQFMLSWLYKLHHNKNDFKEALMILSPLIHICFIQQIRYYFENNYPKKAFLMNLNLHSFMEVSLENYKSIDLTKASIEKRKTIVDRYKEITENWTAKDLLEPIKIKEIIIDTRRQFKSSGLSAKGYVGTLLEDQIIHGYLEEIERLERFIHQTTSIQTASKSEQLLNADIFQDVNSRSIHRLERLDPHYNQLELGFPVPLFNNVHKLGVASELFEIRGEVDAVVARNEEVQESYHQSQIEDD